MRVRVISLIIVLLLVSTTLWAGGGGQAAPGGARTPTGGSQVRESPMLAALVARNALPPLEQRLPQNPAVARRGDANAVYGGQLRLGFVGGSSPDYGWMNRANAIKQDGLGTTAELPYASVVERYEVNADATVFTFHMRRGMKWSDGHPLTTEDVRFWWEDIENNPAIRPSIDAMWRPGGVLMRLEIVDEYTFRCVFAQPYALFPWQMSLAWRGNLMFFAPAHYLKQFHIDYVPDAQFRSELAALNFTVDNWARYFIDYGNMDTSIRGPRLGRPVLTPFWITQNPSVGVWIAERNPYYFEVDEWGRQLPYIDSIRIQEASDTGMLTMMAMSGEIDYLREGVSTLDFPMLRQMEGSGAVYRVYPLVKHDAVFFYFNYGYQADPGYREIVNMREFRQALNYALPRQEIIDNLYLGMAELSDLFPSEFNVARANQLLDQIGMNRRDPEGFRLRPNGQPFRLDLEYARFNDDFPLIAEMSASNWNTLLGIRTVPREIDRALAGDRWNANEMPSRLMFIDPPVFVGNPVMWDWSVLARTSPLFTEYYNSTGQSGTAPVGDILAVYRATFNLRNSRTHQEVDRHWQEVRRVLYDSVMWIVPAQNAVAPVIYSSRLHNVNTTGFMIVSNLDMAYSFIR